jgi:Flp pilus assembly protein CpaB
MNRSRTLILLGIVLLLGAVAVLVLNTQQPQPVATPEPTPVPEIKTTELMIAAQNIPRGTIIGADAVVPNKWPNTSLPPTELIITNPSDIIGKRARSDILRGSPILSSMITADLTELAARGSDASLFIPAGKVAVAFPINQLSSVGYAISAGDHVDVLINFSVVDVDQEGQFPIVPFNRNLVDDLVAAGLPPEAAVSQVLANMNNAQIKPRQVSQLTLQNLEVLHVGEWPTGGLNVARPTPTLNAAEQPQSPPAAPGGTPTPTPPRPTMLILLVEQQQALVLQWLRESGVVIDLALRGATDSAPVSTEAVSYQYILTNFNITIPPKTNTIIQTRSQPAGGGQ